jgi:hypothetical protein
MSALTAILRELAGLFVDDGWLAVAILAVVVLAGLCAAAAPGASLLAGVVLLFGCLGVLVANVLRTTQRLTHFRHDFHR